MDDQELIDRAIAVREKAYDAYSGFKVGAALLDENGLVHIGCNVENSSFPQGTCAETGAIAAMVAAGGRKVVTIAVAGGAESLTACTPCGGCRQRISEFADDDTTIILIDAGGSWCKYSMNDILPMSFRLKDHI